MCKYLSGVDTEEGDTEGDTKCEIPPPLLTVLVGWKHFTIHNYV